MQPKLDGTQGPNGPTNFLLHLRSRLAARRSGEEVSGEQEACLEVENMNFYYGDVKALNNIIAIPERKVTAFIGPSCGKSTLIRIFNRMNDLIDALLPESRRLKGTEIYDPDLNVADLRRREKWFSKNEPFSKIHL